MPRKAKPAKPLPASTKAPKPAMVEKAAKAQKTTSPPPKPPKAAKAPKPKAALPAAKNKKPAPATPAASAFYFDCGLYDPRIGAAAPKHTPQVATFATFEEAKDRAVDALIDLIDHCERRLWQLKRAENFTEYSKLCDHE